MAQSRIPTLVLVASLLGAAAFGVLVPSVAHAGGDDKDNACTTKTFHYKAVEEACKSGGRKAAKKVMGAALKKAKEKHPDWKCSHCHNEGGFDLKDNAVDDLKPFI